MIKVSAQAEFLPGLKISARLFTRGHEHSAQIENNSSKETTRLKILIQFTLIFSPEVQ